MEISEFEVLPNVARTRQRQGVSHTDDLVFLPTNHAQIFRTPDNIESGIGAERLTPTNSSISHVSFYFDIMSGLGMSLTTSNWREKTSKLSKKVFVCAISAITIIQALGKIKWIMSKRTGTLAYCIYLGYYVIRACIRVAFVFVILCKQEKLYQLFKSIKESMIVFQNNFQQRKVKMYILWIVVISLVHTILSNLQSGIPFGLWNINSVVKLRSFEFARTYIYWKKISDNGTDITYDVVDDNYGKEVNVTTILCAIIQILLEGIGFFYENMVRDILLSCSLTLYYMNRSFQDEINWAKKESITNQPQDHQMSQMLWSKYKFMKSISQQLNDIFDHVFHCLHANSFLLGARFLFEITHGDYSTGRIFYYASDVLKMSVTYKLLAVSANANGQFRQLVQESYDSHCTITHENKRIYIPTLLDEIDTNPIGLQSSTYIINSGFNVQFLGTIVYYFLLLVGAADEQIEERLLSNIRTIFVEEINKKS